MTGDQRAILDEIADPQGLSPLLSWQRAALAAALAALDACKGEHAWEQFRCASALADLDACRAALRPVANDLRQPWPSVHEPCLVRLGPYEAAAVLAAVGEERS